MPLLSATLHLAAAGIAMLSPSGLPFADESRVTDSADRARHNTLRPPITRVAGTTENLAALAPSARTAMLGKHPFEDVVWNGRRHRNLCIHMTGGEAVVTLHAGDAPSDDPHGFEVYANRRYDTTSRPILGGRAIEIRTPSYPAYTGRICLGVAPKAGPPPDPAESSR